MCLSFVVYACTYAFLLFIPYPVVTLTKLGSMECILMYVCMYVTVYLSQLSVRSIES